MTMFHASNPKPIFPADWTLVRAEAFKASKRPGEFIGVCSSCGTAQRRTPPDAYYPLSCQECDEIACYGINAVIEALRG